MIVTTGARDIDIELRRQRFMAPHLREKRKCNEPSARAPFRSKSNRSLERGIEILRAFRPGSEYLGNSELVDRTGLSNATITRLTQTLVNVGYLERDDSLRAYRLAAPVLTLGHAFRLASPVVQVASPLMSSLARRLRVNVGLAIRDRDEMVYVETTRCSETASQRIVTSGQRVPIEKTALGRAYMATLPDNDRSDLLRTLGRKRKRNWPAIEADVEDAVRQVFSTGYCVASWQPGVVALSTPISLPKQPVYALNVSVTTNREVASVASELGFPLLQLSQHIRGEFDF